MPRSFRMGTTSFIYPDAALPNVKRLCPFVDDIEILFFDVSDPEGLPDAGALRELAEIKATHDLTYSLHTPLGASLASSDESLRRAGVEQVLRAIAIAEPLEPENTILHVYRGDCEGEPIPDDLDRWRDRARRSLQEIISAGIEPRQLGIEWLDYDLGMLEPVIDEFGISVVLDIGHLYRDGLPLEPVLDRYLDRTSVIHWHGTTTQGRDHRSLAYYPRADALRLLERLERGSWSGVLTLEVFSESDFEESLQSLTISTGKTVGREDCSRGVYV